MSHIKDHNQSKPYRSWGILGAIATLTMTLSAIASLELFQPWQSVYASENSTISTKLKQSEIKVVKIAGTYKTVFTPQFLVDAKKQGLASISGQWIIKPNGAFEAFVNATSTSGQKQTIKTTGRVSIRNGKVVSQVETVNGKKASPLPSTQSYTLLADGKTLQADDQPVKLVKQ
ncbi:hypothetical protein [Pseudanabaena sp. SR411]|uniref:hypothetical protein n=1 Tax=Pseudanabaena sp. SR411 TaxID=1980935 RepID=UPI0011405139|nr:hypothetical protein [Pseudanabaena sp. SR411]